MKNLTPMTIIAMTNVTRRDAVTFFAGPFSGAVHLD
jgi:hypothetical protein|nr:hypothetical protein [Aeromicrobium sp.]